MYYFLLIKIKIQLKSLISLNLQKKEEVFLLKALEKELFRKVLRLDLEIILLFLNFDVLFCIFLGFYTISYN